jgi:hypothetical protein
MASGGNWKKREDPLQKMREHQVQAAEQRRELLERLKSQQAKPKLHETNKAPPGGNKQSAPALDVNAVMTAARSIHLMSFETGLGDPAVLNRPTLALLNQFFEARASGVSASVLQWPSGPRDVSLLHPLAMVALLRAPEKRHTGAYAWCEPALSCRTLYFPWRGGASYAGQRYLLRRADLLEWNNFHLTRHLAQPGVGSPLIGKLHETLGHLNRLRVRETTKPHLAHPALSELYPIFTAEGGDRPASFFARAHNELFARVRFGAALDRLNDHRADLAVPETAPYGLFGVAADADFQRALAARPLSTSGQPPHICILDLSPTPLSRLGPAWSERVEEFIAQAVKRFPGMPFLAVTQDPYVQRKVEAVLRNKLRPVKPTSHVHVRVSSDALTPDPIAASWSPAIHAHFSTTAGPTADAIVALSEAAQGSSDASFAGTLRREMGALRKAASLPCGIAAAYDILCEEIGQASAEAFLERRSSATLIAPIDDALASEIGGAERTRLVTAREAVDRAFKALDKETPIGSLTAEHVASIVRKSSRSIIALATDSDYLLAMRRFADESEAGQALKRKIEKRVIRFTTMDELAGILTGLESAKDRNSWKRLILIAPAAHQLAVLVTRPWIPNELTVVCERTFAKRLAENYQRLADHPDLAGEGQLGARLAAIALAAESEVEARAVATIDLDLEPAGVYEADDTFIDLLDDDADGDGREAIIFTLATGRRLRARPGSAIIRYNQDAEFNPFERATARDVQPRQSIVVPNRAFIAEAREILPIRVLAERWVDVYHTMVEASLPGIKGNSLSAKARTILADMQRRGAGSSSYAAVLDWLRVSEYRQLPPEQRRPHAPQRRQEFDAFVAALGIDHTLAEKMWLEGIQQLRIDRRRAGQRMAQAFISVLIDPHGTASHFTKDIRDSISALRKRALDHLDQVTGRQVFEIEGTS